LGALRLTGRRGSPRTTRRLQNRPCRRLPSRSLLSIWGCWRLIQRVRAKVSQRLCSRRYSARPIDSGSHALWRPRPRPTAASTNEGASRRRRRSSCREGPIRGGYVSPQRGWCPRELGIRDDRRSSFNWPQTKDPPNAKTFRELTARQVLGQTKTSLAAHPKSGKPPSRSRRQASGGAASFFLRLATVRRSSPSARIKARRETGGCFGWGFF
jgi:hypothetical protein